MNNWSGRPEFAPVGHLLCKEGGVEGLNGTVYNYILAQNGLFVEAEDSRLRARIRVAPCLVRGLTPLTEEVTLKQGLLPGWILRHMLFQMAAHLEKEIFMAVIWDKGYQVKAPPQLGTAAGVQFEPVEGAVLEAHSHGRLNAYFSATDDCDEQGFRIYMVVGFPNSTPKVALRVGVYGYYAQVSLVEVFDIVPVYLRPQINKEIGHE